MELIVRDIVICPFCRKIYLVGDIKEWREIGPEEIKDLKEIITKICLNCEKKDWVWY